MPAPDYNNGIIYKLCCKDPEIADVYIGSTASTGPRRFQQHKGAAKQQPNRLVYKFINDNGGFANWQLIVINAFPCSSKQELEKEENRIFCIYRPTLNKRSVSIGSHNRCEHNKIRQDCLACRDDVLLKLGKSSMCHHGIRTSECHNIECKSSCSSRICEHDKIKYACSICSPVLCQFCKTTYSKGSIKKHLTTCKSVPEEEEEEEHICSEEIEEDNISPEDSASNQT
jgi:hypothetical protein